MYAPLRILDVAFVLVWAVLGGVLIRSLMRVWTADRTIASSTAVAVVAAFLAGAMVPFARGHGAPAAEAVAPAQPAAAVAVAPAADGAQGTATTCAPRDHVAGTARGHVDALATDGGPETQAPASFSAPSTAAIALRGWVATANGAAHGACLVVDGAVRSSIAVRFGVSRPDVAGAYNDPALAPSGFAVVIPPGTLSPGDHHVSVGALERGGAVGVPPSTVLLTIR